MFRRALCLLVLVPLVGACAPSLSPLYRDYRLQPAPAPATADDATADRDGAVADSLLYTRLRTALREAGWTEAPPAAANVLSTEPRQIRDWGLYRITLSLDVAPVGDRHVRVFFHPYRRFITGGRSKIPYLDGSLRRAVLPDLNAAFEAQGFHLLGIPRDRDEEET